MKKQFISFLFFCLFVHFASAQIKWPTVTQIMKPWTRWWWEGSAVDKAGLTWNLEQYQKAGLGGVEITPIYGIHGYEDRFINFLSPQWMQMLQHTLNESKRLGLGVDLANATGWPFGGPWVTDEDASKSVYYKTWTVNGGSRLNEPVEYVQKALVRTANNKRASIDSILEPPSQNKNLQSLALDQIQYSGKLPLVTLMAYNNNGQALNLSKMVDKDGKLNWTAPDGKWTLYALFEGLHGKMVERAAPGGEGYAIDHFSAKAAKDYFSKFDEAFKGYDLSYLRGFFNDSYEVDDAIGQANWTNDFFEQFKKRKGYDLKDNLPALFGKSSADSNSRVIYDYRSVIDELILDNFTKEWKKWGASKGKILRNQSHGSPANTLDLYSVVDIPETEGNDILRFKFATSAANVTGKKLVSSESCTWLNEHFLSSWGDVKKAIDLYFLGGVNHIFYHGTEYSPKDVPWPGWLFYAAVHFQPNNPQWKDFHVLNEYITRVQSFLQSSKPDNDILLYYPLADRYSEPGNALLQHFDGMERNFENTEFEHVSKWLVENGYSFDFFSDRQLNNFRIENGKILSGGNEYKTIMLPGNKLIPEKTFEKIMNLAIQGTSILVFKDLPIDVPGMLALEEKRKALNKNTSQLKFIPAYKEPIVMYGTVLPKVLKAQIGKGTFYKGDELQFMLPLVGVDKMYLINDGLSAIKRKNKNGSVYFVNNRTEHGFDGWIRLQSDALSAVLFDPMTEDSGLAKWRKDDKGDVEVYLQLNPFESVIIQTYKKSIKGNPYPYIQKNGDPREIKGEWTIEFLDGGPVVPAKVVTDKLGSWTDLSGDDVKNFSGTARYSISFERPESKGPSWILDLGQVKETAEVWINGTKIPAMIGPTFSVVIPDNMLKQNNKLEIVVANLMANRIAYMDRNDLPWKIFYNTNMPARRRENVRNGLFNAADWKPQSSGLLGPVTLTPVVFP